MPNTRGTKRKRALNLDSLKRLFQTEPSNYEVAWKKLRESLENYGKDQIDSVSFLEQPQVNLYQRTAAYTQTTK